MSVASCGFRRCAVQACTTVLLYSNDMSDPLSSTSSPSRQPLLLAADADTPISPALSADPPPPYPSRERRAARTPRSSRRHARLSHVGHSQAESEPDAQSSPTRLPAPLDTTGGDSETTPLLLSPTRHTRRPRSLSHTSILSYASAAPSLAQTVISLFQDDDDEDEHSEDGYDIVNDADRGPPSSSYNNRTGLHTPLPLAEERRRTTMFNRRAWRRYFRPLWRKIYWTALFHLLVVNFPYALAAWIYLFVFTLVSGLASLSVFYHSCIILSTWVAGFTALLQIPGSRP